MTYHEKSVESSSILGMLPEGAVEFDRVQVACRAPSGSPYTRWIPIGMPKLGEYQYLLDNVFFLYGSKGDAIDGRASGGTGFFVAVPSATYPNQYHHIYAVTNWHVAVRDAFSVIRVNNVSGAPHIFQLDPIEWFFIPKLHDVAVIPIDLKQDIHKVEALNVESFFFSHGQIQHFEINAADDVFMLGRFMDYDGIETNKPSMRFGNISMMEAEVKQPTGFNGASIVLDMHSRSGYSGSPVFVYRTAGSIFSRENTLVGGGHLMKLLGIHWGQFPEEWEIKDKDLKKVFGKSVKGMSGMTLVCPGSAILEVINMKQLRDMRKKIDDELHEVFGSAPESESARSMSGDDILRSALNTAPTPRAKPTAKAEKRARGGVNNK